MRVQAALVASLLLATLPGPVEAHQADSRVQTVVEQIAPAVPTGVVVTAQAGVAAQLLASNSTSRELEVIARGGEPFLRISRRGVFANLASPDFYETSTPSGSPASVPDRLRGKPGTPRFVRISAGDSWGWYDHRLHPGDLQPPADTRQATVLRRFEVPFRYGGRPVSVRGRIEARPVLGGFVVTAAAPPAGVTVDVLQGRLPGLFLANRSSRALTVLGRDGEPFLRFGVNGAEVNSTSRTHVEDRQARGMVAGPASTTPRWAVAGGTTYSWLDARLRYPSDLPPAAALDRAQPTVVDRWSVPVLVDGRRTALAGDVRWVPAAGSPPAVADRSPARTTALVLLAVSVATVAAVVVRRRRAGAR